VTIAAGPMRLDASDPYQPCQKSFRSMTKRALRLLTSDQGFDIFSRIISKALGAPLMTEATLVPGSGLGREAIGRKT
jgi:hypothetical protein